MELIKSIADYLILIAEIGNVKIQKEQLLQRQAYTQVAALIEKEKEMQAALNSLFDLIIKQRKAMDESLS